MASSTEIARPATAGDTPTRHGHIIGGTCEPAPEAGLLPVLAPCTGRIIAEVARGDAGDVARAVAAARAAFPGWRGQTPGDRAKVLMAMADRVDQHVDELVDLESRNVGKPTGLAAEEIPGVAESLRFMAGAARTLQTPAPHEYLAGQLSLLIREPLGVIGAVTPWNYPLMTASWKIAPALAMGNTMVLKPSELTPLSTLRFVELVDDILPPGVLNVVLGTGPEVGAALSQHPDVDMITLTGSVGSGSQVMIDAAPTLKPVHLELGGKAPVVVFSDADLPKVVAAVRMAAFVNTGQECGAATRVLCEESVRDELTRLLVEAVSTIRTGGPEEGPEVEMGPLVSEAHRGRVAAMVERARAAGATVAIGGTPLDREGFFYTPTVITDAPTGSEILTEEIFGPVVTIESFETESEAIASANATRYGLAGSVWTENLRRAMRVTTALDFGTIWANNHLALTPEMPWGGFGNSGHGRECSTLALEDFSRTKHIMITTTQD